MYIIISTLLLHHYYYDNNYLTLFFFCGHNVCMCNSTLLSIVKKMQTYHTAAPLAVHPDDGAAQNDKATD